MDFIYLSRDVLSGVSKMGGMFCPGMFCPAPVVEAPSY